MLIVLSKWPREAAERVPDKIKFKQLLELGQLVCSTGISSVFKPIRQGKEVQEWIKRNPRWTFLYFENLYCSIKRQIKMSDETNKKFTKILFDLREVYNDSNTAKIETAIFRYSSQYKGTEYSSNSELPVDKAIKEYKKYLEWKGGIWR
jgi:hypothetical protein